MFEPDAPHAVTSKVGDGPFWCRFAPRVKSPAASEVLPFKLPNAPELSTCTDVFGPAGEPPPPVAETVIFGVVVGFATEHVTLLPAVQETLVTVPVPAPPPIVSTG